MSVVFLAAGTAGFIAVLNANQNLYNRFFHEDAHMKIGGIAINGTGRTQIWNLLLDHVGNDWIFGKGISSSEDMVKSAMSKMGVGQPHNDYLRFYFDQGIVGLSIYLVFIGGLFYRAMQNLRRSIKNQSTDYYLHIGAMLGLTGVLFSMLTDNSVIYPPVMIPLAILVGCSLGTGVAAESTEQQHSVETTNELLEGHPWMAH